MHVHVHVCARAQFLSRPALMPVILLQTVKQLHLAMQLTFQLAKSIPCSNGKMVASFQTHWTASGFETD